MEINWNRRKYSKEEFILVWNESISYAEVLRKLGLNAYGSSYSTLKNTAKVLGLSSDHFLGQGWGKGRKATDEEKRRKINLKDILVKGSVYSTNSLKKRLIEELGWKYECSRCLNTTWNELPIPLELDHINGVNNDNRIENLRLLCPNCHAQTETYCGRNNKKEPKKCVDCGSIIAKTSTRCKPCFTSYIVANKNALSRKTKIAWPSVSKVVEDVNAEGYSSTARKLGVSDTAVRSFLRRSGIDLSTKPLTLQN